MLDHDRAVDSIEARLPGDHGGPYILVAVFARSVVTSERTGLLGITDIFTTVRASAIDEAVVDGYLVLMFNSGAFIGEAPLSIHGQVAGEPPGSVADALVRFKAPDELVHAFIHMGIPVDKVGTQWFDVELGGRHMTRVSLHVEA